MKNNRKISTKWVHLPSHCIAIPFRHNVQFLNWIFDIDKWCWHTESRADRDPDDKAKYSNGHNSILTVFDTYCHKSAVWEMAAVRDYLLCHKNIDMYKVVVRVNTHVCIADSTSEPLSYSSTAHTRQDYYNRLPLFVNHEQYVALNCPPPNDKCNSNENNNSNPDTTKSHCGVVYFQCRLNKLKCPNTVCSPGIR